VAAVDDPLEIVCNLDGDLSADRVAQLRFFDHFEFVRGIERHFVTGIDHHDLERLVWFCQLDGIAEHRARAPRLAVFLVQACHRGLFHFSGRRFRFGVLWFDDAGALGIGIDSVVFKWMESARLIFGNGTLGRHRGVDVRRS
jgi:hypothetical protein